VKVYRASSRTTPFPALYQGAPLAKDLLWPQTPTVALFLAEPFRLVERDGVRADPKPIDRNPRRPDIRTADLCATLAIEHHRDTDLDALAIDAVSPDLDRTPRRGGIEDGLEGILARRFDGVRALRIRFGRQRDHRRTTCQGQHHDEEEKP